MKREYRRMAETRRLYFFEDIFGKELPAFALKERSHSFLQSILNLVWARRGRKHLPPPVLIFGSGTTHCGQRVSFAQGYSKIELIEGARNVMILLHEITHTLGYPTHGKGFAGKYVELLVEYGKCDEGELKIAMALFNIV